MDLSDVTPEKFFAKVTFQSDPAPNGKLVIPNGDFVQCAILLRLIVALEFAGRKL